MSNLIVFFSRNGENYVSGSVKKLEIGNTQRVADIILKSIDTDFLKLEMAKPYSNIYNECTNQAQVDLRKDARPILSYCPKSIEDYDTIYLGYPNYWGTMPMVLFTFLESFDFSGKTIKPFCTHEGSGLGSSIGDIKRLCPTAIMDTPEAASAGNVFYNIAFGK